MDNATPKQDSQRASLLDGINRPGDLKALSLEQLANLAEEIRARIITTVSKNGGHLSSPLGAVELTLAIHHVFDTEKDLVVWDVGHQCYAHKLITGRRDDFETLRKKDGIAGYPRPAESPYDHFGVGHSSTSISAALGMAIARDHRGDDQHIIAVIGDGAMTGGMALEAFSHAGHVGTDLLVILNDNEMSISKNVGALSAYFNRLITAGLYKRAREDVQSFMKRMLGEQLTRAAQKFEQSVKGLLLPGGLFQELGFNYIGPVDGHDLPTLIGCLSNIRKLHGPVLFHCATQKGKGYTYAEEDPTKYHGVRPYNIETGEFEGEARPPERELAEPRPETFTDAFAAAVIGAAEKDPRIAAITAGMPTGTGLNRFQERFPERFYDVSICEQHAVTLAAGLASRGMRPVCAIYSTFFQRGYDQYVHDVCLQNLPVVFTLDRAGFVGEDGPTHSGTFDLSFLRAIPNITVLAPRDDLDLEAMLHWALCQPGPVAIRYPRDKVVTIGAPSDRDVTRGELLREGGDAALLAVGPCARACLEAADLLAQEGYSVAVADARRVKPLDVQLLDRLSAAPIITVEENALDGGFGSAVMEHFEQQGRLDSIAIRRIGIGDAFVEHATRAEQLADAGLDPTGIANTTRAFLHQRISQPVK
ncbi:MAG TPA: 1-deoxy-D-xylulose-5-phosphate synthase [Candidatus Hydrogenedentes bacterium]|nr:1-deoxy-D-xylulose-5-phosphate synthase [Candidatus Hydrogenedentota bacterium]